MIYNYMAYWVFYYAHVGSNVRSKLMMILNEN